MLEFNPYGREYTENPYPIYARLRDEAPVYHNAKMKFWALSRYEDVVNAHNDPETYSSTGGVTIEGMEAKTPLLIVKDPPEHTWTKRLVAAMFNRPRMAALEVFIRERVIQYLKELYETYGADGEFDIFSKFTVELPLSVISELLGIPKELRADVHNFSNALMARGENIDPEKGPEIARDKLVDLYLKLSRERRANPSDDVISTLIATEVEDEEGVKHKMSDAEIATRFMEMGTAGHETVAKAIPNGLIAFHEFPEQWTALRANPSLTEQAVEEILRFNPPSQLQGRTTTRNVELHGTTIPAGQKVMLLTASATHDPRAFEDPERFDIGRKPDPRSVHFGYGIHKCLGIFLARRELTVAFEELAARFPNISVDPSRAERVVLSNVRGVSCLPARLGAHS